MFKDNAPAAGCAALALTVPPILSSAGYPFTAAGLALVLTLAAGALFERARLRRPAPPRTPDRTISIAVEVETERAREALARLADEAEDLARRAEAAVHRATVTVEDAEAARGGTWAIVLDTFEDEDAAREAAAALPGAFVAQIGEVRS